MNLRPYASTLAIVALVTLGACQKNEPAPTAPAKSAADEAAKKAAAAPAEPAAAPDVRGDGPYDVSEEPQDGLVRLDLGGLRVPGADGMELRLELDEAGETVQAVTVATADSTMQLMAFAAPRTDGIWDDVREEIRKSLAAQGLVDTGRALDPGNEALFTWWAPWRQLKERNIGWRLDYVLASEALAGTAKVARVHREFGTSDHGPVVVEFS